MFRKMILALAAATAIGGAALTPSAASAHPFFHPHFHFGWFGGGGGGCYGYGYGCHGGHYVRKIVFTKWGPRVRWFYVYS